MPDKAADMAAHLLAGGRLAGPEHDRHGPARRGVVNVDRQEAVGVVIGVEERQLLAAVDLVAGVVDVERDARRRRGIARHPLVDEGIGQTRGFPTRSRAATGSAAIEGEEGPDAQRLLLPPEPGTLTAKLSETRTASSHLISASIAPGSLHRGAKAAANFVKQTGEITFPNTVSLTLIQTGTVSHS